MHLRGHLDGLARFAGFDGLIEFDLEALRRDDAKIVAAAMRELARMNAAFGR